MRDVCAVIDALRCENDGAGTRLCAVERWEEALLSIVTGDAAEPVAFEDDAAITRRDVCVDRDGLHAGIEAYDGNACVESIAQTKWACGCGRRFEVNVGTPDAAKGVVGEGIDLLCGIAVDEAAAERDADARKGAACSAAGEAQVLLGIGIGRAERTLRAGDDNGAVDVLEHVVERGRGICHCVCAVCDDEAVI